MKSEIPPPPDSSNLQDPSQEPESLTQLVEKLKQDNQDLDRQLKDIKKRTESLEGAAHLAFNNKLLQLESGKGGEIFQTYRSLLIDNFTHSVSAQVLASKDLAPSLFKSLKAYVTNFTGIIAITGILAGVGIGANVWFQNTAKSVFEAQIAKEYPELLERLERDRETLMLLTLDISSQDQQNLAYLGETGSLSIDPVRAAYLDNNPEYKSILVDFLENNDETTLLTKNLGIDGQNKDIRRSYALNYLLQVPADPSFKDPLYIVLKDEDVDQDTTNSTSKLDIYNQILAVRALRRYPNQLKKLADDVLLSQDYSNLFSDKFWHSFLNDLIFTPVYPDELPVLKQLIDSDKIKNLKEGDDSKRLLASTILVLYTLYPQLCEGDECVTELTPWINTTNEMNKPQKDTSSPGKERTDDNPPNEDGENSSQAEEVCSKLTSDTMKSFLEYQTNSARSISKQERIVFMTYLECILRNYYREQENFSLYQDITLFHSDSIPAGLSILSELTQDYVDLYWDGVKVGQFDSSTSGSELGTVAFEPNLNSISNFYYNLQPTTQNQDTNTSYITQNQDIDTFYTSLLQKTQDTYNAWVVKEIHGRIQEESATKTAFEAWLKIQEITVDQIQDVYSIESFLSSIVWSPTLNRYLLFSEYSAAELAQGREMDSYLSIMAKEYYPHELWFKQIYPEFQNYWSEVVAYDQANSQYLSGVKAPAQVPETDNESQQNALWKWIQANEERLEFRDGRWQLQE